MLGTSSFSRPRAGSLCRVAVYVTAVIWSGWLSQVIASETESQKENRTAPQLVEEALRGEIDGSSKRDELLQAALKQVPDYPLALWHIGRVRYRSQWVPIGEVPKHAAKNRQLTMYRRAREKSPETVVGQRELAAWCGKRGLADQERAHLTKLLELAPNDLEARARLGHVQVAGVWLTREEVREGAARADQAVKALVHWRPILERMRRHLSSQPRADRKRTFRREEALKEWEAIEDPAAIPAVELVFSADPNPRWAMMVVEKLGTMDTHEAAASLARHAVFSRSEAVRQKAIENLKPRHFDDYVPVLLSGLQTPLQTRAALYRTPDGRLLYRQMFYGEGQRYKELAVLDTVFSYVPTSEGDRRTAATQALGVASRTRATLERAASLQNVMSEQLNQRICEVLSATTGEYVASSPESWWQWWNDYNEVYLAGPKPTRGAYRGREVGVTGYRPRLRRSGVSLRTLARAGRRYECLAAGTPIWTELGPVPVEQIKVGDRVLSQDPETGQLTYKPVLRTTIRPTGNLFNIHCGDGTIQANGGHRFWVAGKGWIKTRELEPGSHLHGATGTREIRSVDEGDSQLTYNLIVADFHTYFVGSAKILSHDNTIVKPTNALVPGLQRRKPPQPTVTKGLR